MKREIMLPYGTGWIPLELPEKNILAVGVPKSVTPVVSVTEEVEKALANPIGCKPISELVQPDMKVVIISDDYTRPTPAWDIIPVLLRKLVAGGIELNNVKILVAAGIHRDMTLEELESKFGREVLEQVQIVQHNAMDKKQLDFIGNTSRGTPVIINKEVLRADIKIGLGTVETHPYAGFGGGPKIIMPGIAGVGSIYANHGRLAKGTESWFGKTRGNPCWEDMVEATRMAGLNMVVNVVVTPDQNLFGVFAGDPVEAQAKAIKCFLEIYGFSAPNRADIVIASANPKYHYLDQSAVSMLNTVNVVKDGGTRIVAAYCQEQLGPDPTRRLYAESFSKPWPRTEAYLQEMQSGLYSYEMANAPGIYKLMQAEEKAEMIIVSQGLAELATELHFNLAKSMDEALKQAFRKHGDDASIIIIPHGGMSFPYVS